MNKVLTIVGFLLVVLATGASELPYIIGLGVTGIACMFFGTLKGEYNG